MADAEATMRAVVALEDGAIFGGVPAGALAGRRAVFECGGEVVFVTAMTGYQEVCTDPSYCGQLVVMTSPLIGNYGATAHDAQSVRPWPAALLVRELCAEHFHWYAAESFGRYLARHGVPCVAELDTRALTRHIQRYGVQRGIIHCAPAAAMPAPDELRRRAMAIAVPSTAVLLGEVALAHAADDLSRQRLLTRDHTQMVPLPAHHAARGAPRVLVLDTGVKAGILHALAARDLDPLVVPPAISPTELHALAPDGIVLGNGPGDPAEAEGLIELARRLIPSGIPLLGICLGHQIIALAAGARTSRLAFGHHGANHPVRELRTGRVTITSQNHNYQVEAASLPRQSGFVVSHTNLLDGSVEGLRHRHYPVSSVQFHPEGAPGPHDNRALFDAFAGAVCAAAEARQPAAWMA